MYTLLFHYKIIGFITVIGVYGKNNTVVGLQS